MAFDWKSTLAAVAPTIATALGGPFAGVAVKTAARALGIDDKDCSEAMIQTAVMTGDSTVLLQLKQAEQEFDAEMKRLEVDLARIHATDRSSARQLGIARGLVPQTVLSAIFVCGFVYVLGLLFAGKGAIDTEMMQPAMYVLGILSAGIIQIMNFWFGSSSGSKEKDLHKALPK
ncbi:MAG: hypothetical protein AAGI24_04175 [Pseudomonadota bacterium]